jgi:sulfhydrogenase subunit alpha
VVIPYSQAEGYVFSEVYEDYLSRIISAELTLIKILLNERTKKDAAEYLTAFPSNNIYHNNLAQAIEILQCVDEAIDLLKTIKINRRKIYPKTSGSR